MTTVYVVTRGYYSDYTLVGIFSTREKAEAVDKQIEDSNGVDEEELDLLFDQGLIYWAYSKPNSIEVHGCDVSVAYGPTSLVSNINGVLQCRFRAKSREHAIKIAADKFREFVANNP